MLDRMPIGSESPCPPTRTDPALTGTMVASARITEVFPAPFGPSSPRISPDLALSEMPSTAVTRP